MLTDNFYKNTQIVSYDSDKTWIKEESDKTIFCKKGTKEEVNNQKIIKKLLNDKKIIIAGVEYTLTCPKIYSINDGIIEMEYFDGTNLELLLKDKSTRKTGVEYINSLIKFFIDNKIYWVDFAPRNILISSDTIAFVDFEKGIMDKSEKVEDYLRNHVCEEYGLFLFKDERIFDFDNLFKTNEYKVILVDSISESRYRCIAKLLGYEYSMSYQEYLDILKLILRVEEPYVENGEIVYPGVVLDKFIKDNLDNNPIELYSKEIIKLSKIIHDEC